MKIVTGLLTLIVVSVSGWQALMLANFGVTNQIPQLEGDGGAGLLFAGLCLVGGILSLFWWKVAAPVFALALVEGFCAGWIYSDVQMTLWALGPILLGTVSYFHATRTRRRTTRKSLAALKH